MRMKHFFLICLLFSALFSVAQKNEQESIFGGLSYGLNVGMYLPNYHPANFYNGDPTNENSIDLVFNNYYYVQEIQNRLGYLLDTITPYSLPGKVKYNPAMSVGFHFRYELAKNIAVFAQFTYTKLTASDVFLLHLRLPENYSLDPTYQECSIWGTEKRSMIDIGINRIFPLQDIMNLFVESGLHLNNTRVVENKIQIGEQKYSIVNVYGSQGYIPNAQQQTYEVYQGGIGFGVFFTGGLKFVFNENLSVDPGITFYWNEINLGKYDGFTPNFNPFVRFSFKNLL